MTFNPLLQSTQDWQDHKVSKSRPVRQSTIFRYKFINDSVFLVYDFIAAIIHEPCHSELTISTAGEY